MKCYVCDGEMLHDLPCPEWQTNIRDIKTLSAETVCPECNSRLYSNEFIGEIASAYYCKLCNTQWKTDDLLTAINMIIIQTREMGDRWAPEPK